MHSLDDSIAYAVRFPTGEDKGLQYFVTELIPKNPLGSNGQHKGVKTFMMHRFMFDRQKGVLHENFQVILTSMHPLRSCHKAFAALTPACQIG